MLTERLNDAKKTTMKSRNIKTEKEEDMVVEQCTEKGVEKDTMKEAGNEPKKNKEEDKENANAEKHGVEEKPALEASLKR